MADDLIPPRAERRPAFRFRFGVAYLLLAAVLGAAFGTGILLAGRADGPAKPPWAAWEPTEKDGGDRLKQIAAHVANRYRGTDGDQMVAVFPGPPNIQNVDIRAIAVRQAGTIGTGRNFSVFDTATNLMLILCGGGQNCAISEGTPSAARGQLLRREALELALYTFKFVKEVDSIVAFLPPGSGAQATHLLFFQRGEFSAQLEQPLATTLSTPPRVVLGRGLAEAPKIDRLTLPHFFRFQLQQAQDGSAILVLDPAALDS